ncbi:hypothetical protein Bca52824_073811 [Brassica carinata]|uniref:Uncharacterized protein n=1 Tax=Brassica carinata TaxID=52824 RepID=A0A8X7U5K2_BRACI|nr:hypothetical protein Bca52824_073811 [Brassica carinata]
MYGLEVHEEEGDYGGNAYLEHRRTLPLFLCTVRIISTAVVVSSGSTDNRTVVIVMVEALVLL